MPRLSNHRHERFCTLLVLGNPYHDPEDPESPRETANRANQSYMAAGYRAHGASARVLASRLLARPDIRSRIEELRREEETLAMLRVRRWRALLPKAQETLIRAMDGEEVSASALRAAQIVIERAEGPATLSIKAETDGSRGGLDVWVYGRSPHGGAVAHAPPAGVYDGATGVAPATR